MKILDVGPDAPAPIRWLGALVDWAIILMGMLMVTLVFGNVLMHNLLNKDVAWTTELSELLMVWVTLLGGAAAARRGSHMAITELLDRLHGGMRQLAEAVIQLLVLFVLGLLTWYGIGIADAGRMSVLTVLEWPMAAQYAALPVASAITMVFVAWDLFAVVKGATRAQRFGQRGHA
jgi:TRAP-type transport system small permease protein